MLAAIQLFATRAARSPPSITSWLEEVQDLFGVPRVFPDGT